MKAEEFYGVIKYESGNMALTASPGVMESYAFACALEQEVERLNALINTPKTADFFEAVRLEAAHQQERWGVENDAGKTPADWYWLLGYLAGKALTAFLKGDSEKGKHHIISSAAAMLNWHRHVTGEMTAMRPGIQEPK